MNPLTQVKNTQKITAREQAIGISDEGSWHAKYKDSAYVYVGGLPFDLTEGDVLAVFAQYGEVVDVNLVRDKATGKSKGFAFLAYEDQRSTVLAVDNLNGSRVVGRIIKVDHVGDYKRKLEEDEEEKQKKREERGVCYAFQRGECNRGDDCKFSHDEQRNANTGWGDGAGRGNGGGGGGNWKHDQFDGSMKDAGRRMNMVSTKRNDNGIQSERDEKPRGVCYAFQRGECNRGDSCKFAHDDQNNSGRKVGRNRDEFDGSLKDAGRRMNMGKDLVASPERRNHKSMKPPADRRRSDDRGKEDEGFRRGNGDRGRDDGERRRVDSDRDDRQRNRDRRVGRDDSYEAKDPESSNFRDNEGGRIREERREDRSERRSRDRDGSRGDDGRNHERSVRSRT